MNISREIDLIHGMPEWGLTPDQRMIRSSVLDLLERILPRPLIMQLDEAGEFPAEAYRALAEAGWMGLPFESAYGGMNLGYMDLVVLIETLAYYWNGISSAYLTTVVLGGGHIKLYGNEDQKQRFLPGIISGEKRFAFSLTEPPAGSDAVAIRTRAVQEGNEWVITGSKIYTTGAHVADHLIVATKTDPDAGHRGITMFIVDTKAKGVTIRPLKGLGRRTLHTNEIFFDEVRVPDQDRLGEVNEGWGNLMKCLNLERTVIAASHVGNSQRVVDYAKNHALQRVQFGKPITKFQAVAHKFADMQMLTECARLITYKVAAMMDQGEAPVMETSMAKVIATENNVRVVDRGMQIMGGASYMMEFEMQMYYRDCRIGPIGAGANEIQRTVIAKQMGL
ncbi:MAG TPA: acyl-CoA dehydrogenase family protein [Burkholderiaceae bacterium]|nr:acyl-CoA dehydrogenase family protein [Burkholderiaceae bacterium]